MLLRGAVSLTLLAVLALPLAEAVGVATASVDLGNEWLKIGLVKPGVPMDIVLNQESKRKTRVVIGLRNKERTFSDPGMTVATKQPKYAFTYLTELLGVQVDSDTVRDYQKRFPMHNIEAHPERGTVVFRVGEDDTYTVEELMAHILSHAVSNAANFAEQEITGIVVTVPPYFTQAQRKAVMLVGKLANIKILQLINANTAVAINYGVFRAKSFNETATNILFYDMGATSTVATVASYSTVKEKGSKSKTLVPQVEIKGLGYDRTLGGNAWDLKLRQHLLSEFMKNKKVKGRDVSKNPQAMEKLAQSAEKVKRVLSANKETNAQVEGLFDEIDFKAKVTRDEFYAMTEDLFARVATPITDALTNANLTIDQVDQLIVFGGGIRIPRIEQILLDTMKTEQLGKSINGDEAACLGASYRAAVLSKAFRVSKFLVKDINLYPIEMNYNKTKEGEVKSYTEKIFPRNHPTTKPKILLFNLSNEDFHFELNYGDLSFLTDSERASFGGTMLSAHNLTNLTATVEGHENDTRKGVRVKFGIDDSGLARLTGAEVVYEREVVPEPVEKSTLESLSDFFFGSSDNSTNGTAGNETDGETEEKAEEKAKPTDKTPKDDSKEDSKGDAKKDSKDESASKTEEKKVDDESEKEPKGGDTNSKSGEKVETESTANVTKEGDSEATANATAENTTATTNATGSTEPEKPKIVKVVERIPFSAVYRDIPDPSEEFLAEAKGRIQALVDAEIERNAREGAYNTLEGGIYGARDELTQETFEAVSTEEQREAMNANLTALGEWLEEDGWQANTSVLNAKIKELESTMKSVRHRAAEAVERPKAIAALRDGLNNTAIFYARLLNYSQNLKENETAWHSEKELEDLNSLYNETLTWLDTKEAEQNATAGHEKPVVSSRHINDKLDKLYREVSYLSKRPKPLPKKKKTPKIVTNATNSSGPKIILDGENMTINGTDANVSTANDTSAEDTLATPETVEASGDQPTGDTEGDASKDTKKEDKSSKKEKAKKKDKSKSKSKKDKGGSGKSKKAKASKETDEDKDEL